MKNLNEDLKTGKLKQAYLLYGEENYLKRQYKERITKALLGEDDTMNYAYYEGKGINLKEVIDLAETLPFFAERRLIVFENTGLFKSAGADLADYIVEGKNIRDNEVLAKHADWVEEFLPKYEKVTRENIDTILQEEVGLVFSKVLEDAGVYKCTEKGRQDFGKFLHSVGFEG